MVHDEVALQIANGFLTAAEAWKGCDWNTAFGPFGLNLDGLRSRQTRLLSEATSGEESAAWAAASQWLEQVERHAREAHKAASEAVALVENQKWALARMRINEACELESQYHTELVWAPLRDLIVVASEQERLGPPW